MKYQTATYGEDIKQQYCYDSDSQLFWIVLYNSKGHRLKVCEKSDTEKGAYELALAWVREHLQKELGYISG